MLEEGEKHQGGRPPKNRSHDVTGFRLKEIGVTKSQSSRWQSIPRKDFEGYIREHKQGQKEIW